MSTGLARDGRSGTQGGADRDGGGRKRAGALGPSRFAIPVQQLEASVRVPLAACVASVAEPPPEAPADRWAFLRWADGAVADADGD